MPEIATAPGVKVLTESTGDWQQDQKHGYFAHFNVPTYDVTSGNAVIDTPGWWEGPSDAFVWLGLPFEGYPYTNKVWDPIENKHIKVQTFLDPKKISESIDGIPVKWIAWDNKTFCNIYKRLNEDAPKAQGTKAKASPIEQKIAEIEEDEL